MFDPVYRNLMGTITEKMRKNATKDEEELKKKTILKIKKINIYSNIKINIAKESEKQNLPTNQKLAKKSCSIKLSEYFPEPANDNNELIEIINQDNYIITEKEVIDQIEENNEGKKKKDEEKEIMKVNKKIEE